MGPTKKVETRSWAPANRAWRGWVAVHAAKGYPSWAREMAERDAFFYALLVAQGLDPYHLPTGVILGLAWVDRLVETRHVIPAMLTEQEVKLGDFRPGRWAWFTTAWTPLDTPFPFRGTQGLRTLPERVLRELAPYVPEVDPR